MAKKKSAFPVEVARVSGWRDEIMGRGRSPHEVIPIPPMLPGVRCKPAGTVQRTLPELLDEIERYARTTRKRILAEFKKKSRKSKKK